MQIKQATIEDIDELTKLFAEYRVFYKQEYEPEKSKEFLTKRFKNSDSVIFVAMENGNYAGFTQLYPSFTSVGMKEIWILNDLYINVNYRNKGAAKKLIEKAIEFSKETNRKRIVLSTAFDNYSAQKLYEKQGFTKSSFINYEKITE